MVLTVEDSIAMRLLENEGKQPWEIRGFKHLDEIESEQEWEDYIKEADEDLDDGRFLGRMLNWQVEKPAAEAARIVALRRRLARELNAGTLVELMLVDLLVGNYQMQMDWWELLGSRTAMIKRQYVKVKGDVRGNVVEKTDFEQLADRVVPVLDRLNRQFLRTVKAFRDLKISPIIVNIAQAGQVNVGTEQVNVAEAGG